MRNRKFYRGVFLIAAGYDFFWIRFFPVLQGYLFYL